MCSNLSSTNTSNKLLRDACFHQRWENVLKVSKQTMKHKSKSSPTLTTSPPHKKPAHFLKYKLGAKVNKINKDFF